MSYEYWLKQTPEKPLYPKLLWSKPENKLGSGKILIFGGSSGGFAKVASAFQSAQKSNAGQIRILLPDVLQRTLRLLLPEASFLSSNPSGGFSALALGELVENSLWADGVLVAGDLGHNSETEILMEKFVTEYTGELLLANDSINIFYKQPSTILNRPNTTLVLELSQLQSLVKYSQLPTAVKSTVELPQLVDILHKLSTDFLSNFVISLGDNIVVACKGKVSTTHLKNVDTTTVDGLAANILIWIIQNPGKTFEAISSAAIE
jgi:hypothetical protein